MPSSTNLQIPLHRQDVVAEPPAELRTGASGDARSLAVQSKRRKRCALCCLSSAALSVIAGILGFIFLGPVIAKHVLSASEITFDKLNMTCVEKNQSILVSSDITIGHVAMAASIGAMEVTLMDNEVPFGTLLMRPMAVEGQVDNHRRVSTTELKITNEAAWEKVSSGLLMNETVTWRLKAAASITSHVLGIPISFKDVPFDKQVPFRGFNAFTDSMKVLTLDVVGAHNGSLDMLVSCEVTNPSNVAASMGPLSLELWSAGDRQYKLGQLSIADFTLEASAAGGVVTRFPKVRATCTPPEGAAAAAFRDFLSTFVNGNTQPVVIRGFAGSTPMKHLQPSMKTFVTSSVVPGLVKHRLISRAVMNMPLLWDPMHIPTQLLVQNPFTAEIVFHSSQCEVYPCKTFNGTKCAEFWAESCGTFSPDIVNESIPGRSEKRLKKHSTVLHKLLTPEMIQTIFLGAGNGSVALVKGTTTMLIGGIKTTIDYVESFVPLCLVLPLHGCENFL